MSRMSVTPFKDLVQSKYIDSGAMSKTAALNKIAGEAGIGRECAWKAFHGTRVQGETAESLMLWAALMHHVDLDAFALTIAPTTPPRSQGDVGKRAEEAIEAAVHRACLPPELACTIAYDLSVGAWLVRCVNRLGGPDNEQTHVDLPEALSAVVDTHHGRRSA